MGNIRIVPVQPYFARDSFIVSGDTLFTANSFMRKPMQKLFAQLVQNGIFEINLLDARLSRKKPVIHVKDVVEYRHLVFLDRNGWHNEIRMETKMERHVLIIAAAILWKQSKRFIEQRHFLNTQRVCVLCGATQEGKIVGRANLSGEYIVSYEHNYCIDPMCISHVLERAINPNYKAPGVTQNTNATPKALKEVGEPKV